MGILGLIDRRPPTDEVKQRIAEPLGGKGEVCFAQNDNVLLATRTKNIPAERPDSLHRDDSIGLMTVLWGEIINRPEIVDLLAGKGYTVSSGAGDAELFGLMIR